MFASILSMSLFALLMSVSPGPVNLIALSTGTRTGLLSAVPFVLGATLGFTLLLIVVGLGLYGLTGDSPVVRFILSLVGASYLVYLGRLIYAAEPAASKHQVVSKGFVSGALLQWLNPKAWSASASGVVMFELAGSASKLALFVALYAPICLLGIGVWAWLGARLRQRQLPESAMLRLNQALGLCLMVLALLLVINQLLELLG
ncbi:hypothetical protein GCM10008090_20440 [Arenicella chitinivorans]|uniref:Threonine/homoserine/homoserine lactone efflux protein n=1 Tax=Arenicella chitinivorans TaxID=1329800 RepID=A0A918RTM6_9GAMM|nr:LysE family transporter [Arenicella chitinivorans]GHA10684.1 hypothetical protein GCM10008090_20440 [Arenicella chitinivorans]